MTLLLVASALLAMLAAAFCAFADGALLAIDEDDPPKSPAVAALLARRERTHRALAFGRILSQLLAGAGTAAALKASGVPAVQVVPFVLVLGILIVVIAESAARAGGDMLGDFALARVTAGISAIENLLRPVVAFGTWTDRLLHTLLPPPAQSEEDRETTIEQFREVVAAEADVSRDDEAILKGVFSLGDTTVQDIMVPRVDIVGVERGVEWPQVVDRVRAARHARLVVFDGTLDEVVGILYAKDCLPSLLSARAPAGGWHALIRPASFIPGTKLVDDLLREFLASRRHLAIVVDEYGGTAGLVTLEDALELIVGEIRDENDVEEPDVVRDGSSAFRLSARVTLDELTELTGQDFTRAGVQTVGGLVYELMGRVPRQGEALTIGHFRLVVERVERRRVARVRLERLTGLAGAAK